MGTASAYLAGVSHPAILSPSRHCGSPEHEREVEVIFDKSNRTEKYSGADFLLHEGVPTFIDAKHAIAHNKIMVVDSHTVLTGGFNFTKAAETSNAENLLVIDDAALAKKYTANWKAHLEHSEPYTDTKGTMSDTRPKRKRNE